MCEEQGPLQEPEAKKPVKSVSAPGNYLKQGRPDISYNAKEAMRTGDDGVPTTFDVAEIAKQARYVKEKGRLVQLFV